MGDPEQHQIPFKERRFRNPKLRRGIFLIPSLFTTGNLVCGYYASAASLAGGTDDFDRAAKAIGLAILFDSLDGRVARLTGTNTEFGMQFDSLADVVSFGMAPGGSKYFVGMPTPAAAGMIAATVHMFKAPIQDVRWSIAWILLALCLAGLMTSTIRFSSFKDLPWTRKQPSLTIVVLALVVAAIWRWSEEVLFLMAAAYTVTGVVIHVVRMLRHRLVSR